MLIFIPGNVPSSKNSRINLKSGVSLPSEATTLWRRRTQRYWSLYRKHFNMQCQGKGDFLIVGIHFIRGTRHKWDFINPCQTIQDEMTKHKWIEDDNTDCIMPFPMMVEGKFWSYDSKNPGVLIRVHSSIDDVTFSFPKSIIQL